MNWPYELQIGWRYTRAGRVGRRNRFISFISGVSMLGIALGVAALIIVLSVMNGFQKEVRDRMLSVISHVEVSDAGGAALPDWRRTASEARRNPQVIGAAPFVASQALIARGDDMRGIIVRGIVPQEEATVTDLAAKLKDTTLARLVPGAWGVVLGGELARSLGVRTGDKVTVDPARRPGDAGRDRAAPALAHRRRHLRRRPLRVRQRPRAGRPRGRRQALSRRRPDRRPAAPEGPRPRAAGRRRARATASAREVVVRDWTSTNRNWFSAVQVEKRLMFIILTLIVAVAAFNLVSTLVMTVTDKRADIAILRTLGATPRSVMGIFIVQGAASGVIGTLAGVALGLLVAYNIDVIVPAIERLLHVSFLPSSVYLISRMPSDPQQGDIVPIAIISLVLAFLATLYPSWRASRMQPAEALRYE